MNAIGVIAPYKYEGMWVFDDPAVGLVREPFVSGIDTMIDRLLASIPDADKGFRLLFSSTPFPGYTVKLEWRREEYGGNWYYRRSTISKAGCVPPCSSTSTRLHASCMVVRSQRQDRR